MVAEDDALLREGLVLLLRGEGVDVVAGVGDPDALLDAVEEHRPDVAIVDVRMPPTHTDEGIRAAVAARAAHPELAVLVLSAYVSRASPPNYSRAVRIAPDTCSRNVSGGSAPSSKPYTALPAAAPRSIPRWLPSSLHGNAPPTDSPT